MKPTDRSISPQISSRPRQCAMMMIGAAMAENRLPKLALETKLEVLFSPKYNSSATATTRIVASRCRTKRPTHRRSMSMVPLPGPGPPPGSPISLPARSVVSLTSALLVRSAACRRRVTGLLPQHGLPPPAPFSRARGPGARSCQVLVVAIGFWIAPDGRGMYFCRGRRTLETAGLLVGTDAALRDEAQAGVGVRRAERAAGEVVQVKVQRRQESLQVGVLVDGEIGEAAGDVGQRQRRRCRSRRWGSTGPAFLSAAARNAVEPASTANAPFTALVPEQVRHLGSLLDGRVRAGRDLGDRVAAGFSTEAAPSYRGWMFAWPGVAMKITTSPGVGTTCLIRLPSCWPEVNSAWPT